MLAEIDAFRTLVLQLSEYKGGVLDYVTEALLEERLQRHTEETRALIDTSIMDWSRRQERMTENVEQLAKAAMTMAASVTDRMEDVVRKLDHIDTRSDERHKETVNRLEKMSAEVESWTTVRRTALTMARIAAALPLTEALKRIVQWVTRLVGWLSVLGGAAAFGVLLGLVFVSLVRSIGG